MNRHTFRRLVATGVTALAVLATVAAPAAASSRSASLRGDPAAASPPGSVLSVRGAGPYRIGARQHALAAAGLISWVAEVPGCDIVRTGATGEWAGVVLLAFRNGRLVEVGTATAPPRSPAGASVGMSWTMLEDIYGSRGKPVHNDAGDLAYVVRIGSRVELYTGHPIRPGVGYFQVGPADFVLRGFRHGPAC
jgi:hypothetical protein